MLHDQMCVTVTIVDVLAMLLWRLLLHDLRELGAPEHQRVKVNDRWEPAAKERCPHSAPNTHTHTHTQTPVEKARDDHK